MAGKGCSVPVSSSLLTALVRVTSHMREVKQLGGKTNLKLFLKVLPEIVKVGCPFGHTYEIRDLKGNYGLEKAGMGDGT